MSVEFQAPWRMVEQFSENLVNELQHEVTAHHPLWGKSVRAIAQRIDSDAVLFEIAGESKAYAVVHLTWSGEPEKDSRWPDTKLFPSLDEWVRDGMVPDHREYTGDGAS